MKKIKDNKYSNYLLILLLLVLLGVIGFKIFENYNIKHFVFEEQKVVRVKVEINEMEEFYTINFTSENDMVKALTVRNKLRETAKHDETYEGFYGNVHFTVYDEDGRERYDEFDDIVVEDFVWALLDINSAKPQYIESLNLKSNDIKRIKIINPFTDEITEIENDEKEITGYSGLEVIDSLIVALKRDIMANEFYTSKAECKYLMTIEADKEYKINILDNYENIISIIYQICPEVEFQIEDLESLSIRYGDRIIEITKDEFEDAKEVVDDVLSLFVPYTNINSSMLLEFTLNEDLDNKKVYGSIHKDDVTEKIFDLFE